MAVSFVDAVGLISGALGIVSFTQGLIPAEKPPQGAIIRIKAGNPGDEDVDEVSFGGSLLTWAYD